MLQLKIKRKNKIKTSSDITIGVKQPLKATDRIADTCYIHIHNEVKRFSCLTNFSMQSIIFYFKLLVIFFSIDFLDFFSFSLYFYYFLRTFVSLSFRFFTIFCLFVEFHSKIHVQSSIELDRLCFAFRVFYFNFHNICVFLPIDFPFQLTSIMRKSNCELNEEPLKTGKLLYCKILRLLKMNWIESSQQRNQTQMFVVFLWI